MARRGTSECRAVSGEKSYRLAAAGHVRIGERRRGRGNRPVVKNKYAIRPPNGKQRDNNRPPAAGYPGARRNRRDTSHQRSTRRAMAAPTAQAEAGRVPSGSVSRFFGCRLSPEIPPLTAASHGPRPASACDTASRRCALSIAGPSPYNCAALRPGFAFGRKRVARQPGEPLGRTEDGFAFGRKRVARQLRPPRGHQRYMRFNAPAMGSQWKLC